MPAPSGEFDHCLPCAVCHGHVSTAGLLLLYHGALGELDIHPTNLSPH